MIKVKEVYSAVLPPGDRTSFGCYPLLALELSSTVEPYIVSMCVLLIGYSSRGLFEFRAGLVPQAYSTSEFLVVVALLGSPLSLAQVPSDRETIKTDRVSNVTTRLDVSGLSTFTGGPVLAMST